MTNSRLSALADALTVAAYSLLDLPTEARVCLASAEILRSLSVAEPACWIDELVLKNLGRESLFGNVYAGKIAGGTPLYTLTLPKEAE